MGGEDQLKALVRQGFALQNTADKSVLTVDGVLAQTMGNVKRLVESLPQEGLLRNKAWRDLEPLVKEELDKYGRQLGKALVNSNSQAAPDMRDYAVREFDNGGADLPEAVRVRNQPVPGSVEMALRSQVNNMTLDKMFNVSGKAKGEAPILKALFKTVDTRVRGGIIRGDTTKDIADLMATDVITSGIPGVKLTAPVAKQIQSQAMTIARTATQDMARQVKEQLYEQNKAATEGMVWQWSTALDSRTCETCAPLDARRWPQDGKTSPPTWPIHPNCRCQSLLIDPEDPFWNGDEVTAQQIRPAEKGAYADGYKTPITINGEKFYRKAITVTSDTGRPRYSDVLAKWATDSSTSLDEALGPGRARWFKAQYQKMNADPQKILQAMLTQKPAGQQTFISLEALQKKSLDFKPKPKPKPTPAAAKPKPKPKPKPKAPAQANNAAKAAAAPEVSTGIAARVVQPGAQNQLVFAKQGGTSKMFADSFSQLEAVEGQVGAHARKMRQFIEKQNIMLHPGIPEKFANGERFRGNQQLIKAQRAAVDALKKQGNNPGALNGASSLLKALEEGQTSELKHVMGKLSAAAGYTTRSSGIVNAAMTPSSTTFSKKQIQKMIADAKDSLKRQNAYIQHYKEYKPGTVAPKASWDASGAPPGPVRADQWLATTIHEVGHQVHYRGMAATKLGNKYKGLGGEKFVSQYAHSNEFEQFAEAFVHYVLNPSGLQASHPRLYKWVEDALEEALK